MTAPRFGNWISVEDELPGKEKKVIYNGFKSSGIEVTVMAMFIPKFYLEDEGGFQGDCEYSEEKDAYNWPEGWYEWNEYEETHWKVPVLTNAKWMPAPTATQERLYTRSELEAAVKHNLERAAENAMAYVPFGDEPPRVASKSITGIEIQMPDNF